MGPTQPTVQRVAEYVSVLKRPGRKGDHSPAFNINVKNEWSCTSTLHICLNEMGRNNTFCTRIVWGAVSCPNYTKLIAVCSQIHTNHKNTLCGQNVE